MSIFIFILEIILLFFLSRSLHKRLSSFFFKVTKSKNITVWLMALLFFPGTLVHEMAHFLTALFLFVPVDSVELLPTYEKKRIKLGSVSLQKADPFRSFLIAIAPFIYGNAIMFCVFYFFINNQNQLNIFYLLIVFYLLLAIANTMFLSKKDFSGVWRLILALIIFYALLYFCGIRVPLSQVNLVISRLEPVFESVYRFLLVPIISDLAVVGFLSIISKDRLIIKEQ